MSQEKVGPGMPNEIGTFSITSFARPLHSYKSRGLSNCQKISDICETGGVDAPLELIREVIECKKEKNAKHAVKDWSFSERSLCPHR